MTLKITSVSYVSEFQFVIVEEVKCVNTNSLGAYVVVSALWFTLRLE